MALDLSDGFYSVDKTKLDSKPPASRDWTPEEDAKLNSAVTETPKKKWGKKYKTDWPLVSEKIPDRSRYQCWKRWHV
jgi:hypothetical protein